jgi:hypothetical protein
VRNDDLQRRVLTSLLFLLRVVAAAIVLALLLAPPSVVGVAVALAVAALFAGSIVRWTFLLLVADPAPIAPKPGLRVAAVTTFVPGSESLSMLERTLRAMTGMAYAHDTWLLDEGDDPHARALCDGMGVRHWSRRDRPDYQSASGRFASATKHGNYNAWLDEIGFAKYDVLAALDPDHVPETNFLSDTLGLLATGVAYVQSPQEYHNTAASLVARGCSEEGRDFYWITQRAFHRFGAPSLIGAHGVHDLRALREFGGLAPHVADDLLLTLHYQLSGWRGVYVARVLARGLAPVDWATYIKQQRRWARSLFDVKLRIYPRLTAHMMPRTRIVGFLQGLTYLQDAFVGLCCAAAICAMLVWGVPSSFIDAATQPALIGGIVILLATGLYPHRHHGPHRNAAFYWRSGLLRAVKWPYTLLALLDVVRDRDRGYELTAKHDAPRRGSWLLYWPHIVTCAIILLAWAIGMASRTNEGVLPTVLGVVAAVPSLLVLTSGLFRAPAAYDAARFDQISDGKK